MVTSRDLATLHLGTAARCLAYSSRLAMGDAGEGTPTSAPPRPNDFALLEISDDDRGLAYSLAHGTPDVALALDDASAPDARIAGA